MSARLCRAGRHRGTRWPGLRAWPPSVCAATSIFAHPGWTRGRRGPRRDRSGRVFVGPRWPATTPCLVGSRRRAERGGGFPICKCRERARRASVGAAVHPVAWSNNPIPPNVTPVGGVILRSGFGGGADRLHAPTKPKPSRPTRKCDAAQSSPASSRTSRPRVSLYWMGAPPRSSCDDRKPVGHRVTVHRAKAGRAW